MAVMGIDFGTTNSVAAVFNGGDVEVLELDTPPDAWAPYGFGRVIPSVFAADQHGRIAFGWEAKAATDMSGDRFDAIKRLFASQEDAAFGDGGTSIAVEEAATLLFAEIQRRAQTQAAIEARQAVITVPANSKGRARHRTKICAGMGGFEVLSLINEPTAAAMAYARSHPDARRYLVFDWGGGTLDVTVLEAVEGVFIEQASSGIARSGGLDFDARLSKYLLESAPAPDSWSTADKRQFRLEVELAKIRLSTQETASVILPGGSATQVTRRRFEEIVDPLIQESAAPIERCLRELNIGRGSIDALVLVGGTSNIPAVRRFVQDLVGTDADPDVDPMTAIGEGAAIAASIMAGENTHHDFYVSTEHALGTFVLDTQTVQQAFSTIIPKSHKLPARATQTYFPVTEEQRQVNVDVVEGDPETGDFVVLKEWLVALPDAGSDQGVELTFDYDVSGILNVRAVDHASGQILLDDDVAYGVAEDKMGMVRMAQRARDSVTSGTMSAAPEPVTSALSEESMRLMQSATQKVIPYLDTDAAAHVQALVDELQSTSPSEEDKHQDALRQALQPYSFLM